MQLINHQSLIKCFGNGFQITFPNRYTVIVKNGVGTKSTNTTPNDSDPASMILSARFGGSMTPDCEVEIYNPNKQNVSEKFGSIDSLPMVTMLELVNILYVVSSLK